MVPRGARGMCCCLQELLLKVNIEEMRCAVPRSRGTTLVQVIPALYTLGQSSWWHFLTTWKHSSLCPVSGDMMSPSFSLFRFGS